MYVPYFSISKGKGSGGRRCRPSFASFSSLICLPALYNAMRQFESRHQDEPNSASENQGFDPRRAELDHDRPTTQVRAPQEKPIQPQNLEGTPVSPGQSTHGQFTPQDSEEGENFDDEPGMLLQPDTRPISPWDAICLFLNNLAGKLTQIRISLRTNFHNQAKRMVVERNFDRCLRIPPSAGKSMRSGIFPALGSRKSQWIIMSLSYPPWPSIEWNESYGLAIV